MFGGLRGDVLERDHFRAQCCGAIEDLIVHHRRPGRNARRLLISLCRRCHAKVHRTLRPGFSFPEQLRELWREAHPELAEQLCFRLTTHFSPDNEAEQPALFEAAA
jgi:5-methylcytosine-specific restriction endonuclease McrA